MEGRILKVRKVCIITGTRAEYGLLKPVMQAIADNDKLDLAVIASGMHLSHEFGHTIDEIIEDGFNVNAKVEMNPVKDSSFSMAHSVGKGIIGMSNAYEEIKPDIVLVLGDRIEAFAGGIAAALMNIPLAHIHGGDSARAGLDESMRHGLTKFAHIHFAATEKSAERIKKMGEDDWRISIVGAPGLDSILNKELLSKEDIQKKFMINFDEPFILLVQHSVSTEPEDAKSQIIETLEAIKELKLQTIIIYPNSDAGGREIIKQIRIVDKLDFIKAYKSLPHLEYLSIMKYANVMVGNSSSGIIESSSFQLPVVNIGIRQDDRERSTNVIDVRKHEKEKIAEAIKKALYNDEFKKIVYTCTNPYGDGKASKRIVKKLNEIKINKKLIQKKLSY